MFNSLSIRHFKLRSSTPSLSTTTLLKSHVFSPSFQLRKGINSVPEKQNQQERFGFVEKPGTTQKKLTDTFCGHRTLVNIDYSFFSPKISPKAFIAPSATLAGNVVVYDHSSIWYNCILKADVHLIRIGANTNIQDGTVIHEAFDTLSEDHDGTTIIGHFVTIGHNCILSACTVESFCLVGMGSVLQPGAYMEKYSMLGAGSVLKSWTRVPSGELWVGNPAKFKRKLTEEEMEDFRRGAEGYKVLSTTHKDLWEVL